MKPVRFAAIGLDHFHIYGQIDLLLRAGAEFVAYYGEEQKFFPKPFATVYPQAQSASDVGDVLDPQRHQFRSSQRASKAKEQEHAIASAARATVACGNQLAEHGQ